MVSYLGKGKQILLFPSDYYLPKDETEFYRFCYVDGAGQLRGASTPFRFRKSKQQNAESRLDDNLLIVTTQVSDEMDTKMCQKGVVTSGDLLAPGTNGTEHSSQG